MKPRKSLSTIALLMILLGAMCLLTWLIPSGAYQRVDLNGRLVVDPSTFSFIENRGVSLFDYFLAIPNGFVNGVSLIIGFMFINGTMEVINKTGALNIGITRAIKRIGIGRGNIVLVVMFYIFAVLGGFLGFVEGSLPFFPIAIAISIALGYDGMVGVAISMVGAVSGFLCGPTNPSSVAISQSIAGLELYSGIGLRLTLFAVATLISLVYILWYAKRVKAHPEKSLVAGVDTSDIAFNLDEFETENFTSRHAIILVLFCAVLLIFVYGAIKLSWGFLHLAALFVIIAVLTAIVGKIPAEDAINTFTSGCAAMMGGSLVLAIAYGLAWVLSKASVLDTIIYYISGFLRGKPAVISVIGVLVAVMLVNLLIPSGSAKAAIIMPIIVPIVEIVGLTAQTGVLAYQLGDGITNLCGPLYGTMLLVCSMGKVPFSKWERFILPLVGILTVIAILFLLIAVQIGY